MCFQRYSAFQCGHATCKEQRACDNLALQQPTSDTNDCNSLVTTLDNDDQQCGIAGYYCKHQPDGARMERIHQDLEYYERQVEYFIGKVAEVQALRQEILDIKDSPHELSVQTLEEANTKANAVRSLVQKLRRKAEWTIVQLKRKVTVGEHHFKVVVPEAEAKGENPPSLIFPPDEQFQNEVYLIIEFPPQQVSHEASKSDAHTNSHSSEKDTNNPDHEPYIEIPGLRKFAGMEGNTQKPNHTSAYHQRVDSKQHGQEQGDTKVEAKNNDIEQHPSETAHYDLTTTQDIAQGSSPAHATGTAAALKGQKKVTPTKTFLPAALTSTPAIAQLPIDPETGDRSTQVKAMRLAYIAAIGRDQKANSLGTRYDPVTALRQMSSNSGRSSSSTASTSPASAARVQAFRTPPSDNRQPSGNTLFHQSANQDVTSSSEEDIHLEIPQTRGNTAANSRPRRNVPPVDYVETVPESASQLNDDVFTTGRNNNHQLATDPSLLVKIKVPLSSVEPAQSSTPTSGFPASASAVQQPMQSGPVVNAQPYYHYTWSGSAPAPAQHSGLTDGAPFLPNCGQQAYQQPYSQSGQPLYQVAPYNNASIDHQSSYAQMSVQTAPGPAQQMQYMPMGHGMLQPEQFSASSAAHIPRTVFTGRAEVDMMSASSRANPPFPASRRHNVPYNSPTNGYGMLQDDRLQRPIIPTTTIAQADPFLTVHPSRYIWPEDFTHGIDPARLSNTFEPDDHQTGEKRRAMDDQSTGEKRPRTAVGLRAGDPVLFDTTDRFEHGIDVQTPLPQVGDHEDNTDMDYYQDLEFFDDGLGEDDID